MKNLKLIGLFVIATILFVSCKETKKEAVNEEAKSATTLTIDKELTTIEWIAYKTTSKTPVKGSFTEFTASGKGYNAAEVINGLKFSIPVNSLHTNDSIRDAKLIKSFFGSLENTSEITGTLQMNEDNTGTAEISMNGISQSVAVTYSVNNEAVSIESVIDLKNWKAQAAIEALNAVCFDLHKGADGVSKTWDEVKIEVVIQLKEE